MERFIDKIRKDQSLTLKSHDDALSEEDLVSDNLTPEHKSFDKISGNIPNEIKILTKNRYENQKNRRFSDNRSYNFRLPKV